MSDPRLAGIYSQAGRLFIRNGYARTQISHIARACGISVGSVYSLFTGKEAILSFILKCTMDPAFIEGEHPLPMGKKLFTGLDGEIIGFFARKNDRFARGLEDEGYGFPQMLSDAYDLISSYGMGCLLIEHNPAQLEAVAEHYRDFRLKFFALVLRYVRRYMDSGEMRRVDTPELCVSLMVETISWWGMHLKLDAFAPREDIPDETAKAVCMDALIHAYGA